MLFENGDRIEKCVCGFVGPCFSVRTKMRNRKISLTKKNSSRNPIALRVRYCSNLRKTFWLSNGGEKRYKMKKTSLLMKLYDLINMKSKLNIDDSVQKSKVLPRPNELYSEVYYCK